MRSLSSPFEPFEDEGFGFGGARVWVFERVGGDWDEDAVGRVRLLCGEARGGATGRMRSLSPLAEPFEDDAVWFEGARLWAFGIAEEDWDEDAVGWVTLLCDDERG